MISRRKATTIVWMRHAYRLQDNTALLQALGEAGEIVPIVCLSDDGRYLHDTPRRRFVRNALTNLDMMLKRAGSALHVRVGDPLREIPAAAAAYGASAVYAVQTYDPRLQKRDRMIAEALRRSGSSWKDCHDVVVAAGNDMRSSSGDPYRVFTPFKKAWLTRFETVEPGPPPVRRLRSPALGGGSRALSSVPGFADGLPDQGETRARVQLASFLSGKAASYGTVRDNPGTDGTSRLSPHLALGTISIRTVFREAFAKRRHSGLAARASMDVFINELVWREFYYHVLANFPFVVERSFKDQYFGLRWSRDEKAFSLWCEGQTGYPVVDAAMRQLQTEGWINNRVRMIAASFLTKDLHIDWRRGESFFLNHLIDADLASNNGGWQWTAGTGTDAAPYFRIFNPVLQGARFDPDGRYIRHHVPELAGLPLRYLHQPWKMTHEEQQRFGCILGRDYPIRIVDHASERSIALAMYQNSPAPG